MKVKYKYTTLGTILNLNDFIGIWLYKNYFVFH